MCIACTVWHCTAVRKKTCTRYRYCTYPVFAEQYRVPVPGTRYRYPVPLLFVLFLCPANFRLARLEPPKAALTEPEPR